jgi:site-specific DNA-methyltransferase (adenine-specific)/modification methylase
MDGGRVTLLRGDSRTLLANVPDGSVDLLLTDPPYNLSPYSTGNMQFKWRGAINNDLAAWDQAFDPAEYHDEFLRVLKPTGNLFAFCSYNLMGRWHEVFDPLFDTFQFFVWHKSNPVPKVRRQGFLNSCELIVCMWNKGHTWNFGRQRDMHNFLEAPICMGPERLKAPKHPAQKPVRLLKHLIGIASSPDGLVLDPFMGVGSTGVAALQLERRFIGMERDPGYFAAAEQRLAIFCNKEQRA